MQTIYAEYDRPEQLAAAIEMLHDEGVAGLNAYGPTGEHGIERALGLPPSRLPQFIAAAGVVGAATAYFVQWLLVAHLYPLNVGGRPAHMPLAFLVLTFEIGVLFAAGVGVGGLVYSARLGRLYRPVFEVPGLATASVDRHWVEVPVGSPERAAEVRTMIATTYPERVFTMVDGEVQQ